MNPDRIPLGSWTCPSGNSVDVTLESEATAFRTVLAWDSPPPFTDPTDLAHYVGVILPAIVQRAREYTETTGRAVVVLGT